MKLVFPRAGSSVTQGPNAQASREWGQWFRGISTALGLWPSAPMYAETTQDTRTMTTAGSGISFLVVTGILTVRSFSATSNASLRATLLLPNNYRDGSDLVPFLEWCPSDAVAGDVMFELEYSITRNGVVFPSTTAEKKTVATPEVDNLLQRVEFTAIDGEGIERGDTILLSIGREGANAADTYANVVGVVTFGFKHEIATVGHEEKFA